MWDRAENFIAIKLKWLLIYLSIGEYFGMPLLRVKMVKKCV